MYSYSSKPTARIDKSLLNLLSRVLEHITLVYRPGQYTSKDLITKIAIQVRDASDNANLPIFRIESKFYLYKKETPILIPNRNFETFLTLVGKQIGVPEDIFYGIPFRDAMFGACWRLMVED